MKPSERFLHSDAFIPVMAITELILFTVAWVIYGCICLWRGEPWPW
jgi:hypothetical protein